MKERVERILNAYRDCVSRVEAIATEPFWEQVQVESQPVEDSRLKERLESLIQRGESLHQEIKQRVPGEP